MILDAIASHPDGAKAVRMVATDGVYFWSEHPTLPVSKTELGKWGMKKLDNMLQFKPGFYWTEKEANKLPAAMSLKSRGLSAKDLAKEAKRIMEVAKNWTPDQDWPVFRINVGFNITSPAVALRQGRYPGTRSFDQMILEINGDSEANENRSKWFMAGLISEDSIVIHGANPHNKRRSCSKCVSPLESDNRHVHDMKAVYQDPTYGEWRAGVYEYGNVDSDTGEALGGMMHQVRVTDPSMEYKTDNGDIISLTAEAFGRE
jgi:hypothetical protein